MELQHSQQRIFIYRLLGKIHQLFQIILHFIFKIANHGNQEKLPQIDNFLLLCSAESLASRIRMRKLKSVDVVKAYISRIQDVNPVINAVVATRSEEALTEAKQVDKLIESGTKTEEELEKETPFLGVPFTSKEILCVKGMPATAGLQCRKGNLADKDAEVVRLMKKAGAIPLAVTNIPELCMWSETHNKVYGRSSNPYDITRCVGGSSGGEGAIISAAGSVIGLGSDVAGSIRIPSCFNGIFGHKPSAGILSNVDCFRVLNKDLECYLTSGPMCRYATDLLPMMKILAGSAKKQLKLDYPVKLDTLKIFYMEDAGDYGLFTKVHPDIKAALKKVLKHFQHAYKTKPQRLELPILRDAIDVYIEKTNEKGGFQISKGLSGKGKETNLYLQLLLWFFGQSRHTLHILMVGLLEKITQFMNYFVDQRRPVGRCEETIELLENNLSDNGVFLYPTWPEPAPYHHEMLFKPFNCGYTNIFNVLGLPVTQCPVGLSESGLPIGLQVVSNKYNDHLCLAVAVELEKALGGWVPPCAVVE